MGTYLSRHILSVTAVACFSIALPYGPVWAQGASVWGSDCRVEAGSRLCILSQKLVDEQGGFLSRIRLQPRNDGALLQVLLPAGVHLGSGAFYSVDTGPEAALSYLRCDARICEASRALSDTEWTSMKRGAEMSLLYRPDAGSDPAILTVSLAGLTAAATGATP